MGWSQQCETQTNEFSRPRAQMISVPEGIRDATFIEYNFKSECPIKKPSVILGVTKMDWY
jgi:hypothetical protein